MNKRGSVNLGPRVWRLAKRIADREQRTIVTTIERALTAYDAGARSEGSTK